MTTRALSPHSMATPGQAHLPDETPATMKVTAMPRGTGDQKWPAGAATCHRGGEQPRVGGSRFLPTTRPWTCLGRKGCGPP